MASKIRPLVKAIRHGCGKESPRLACQAANMARQAGAVVRQKWPGIKAKVKGGYEGWKSSVSAGGEFISLCHQTGKIVIWVAAPGVLIKISYTEYRRNPEAIDKSSIYEKSRAAVLAYLHYADPELAELSDSLSSVLKAPEEKEKKETAEEFGRRVVEEELRLAAERFHQILYANAWRVLKEQTDDAAVAIEGSDAAVAVEGSDAAVAVEESGDAVAVEGSGADNAPGWFAWLRIFYGERKDAVGPSMTEDVPRKDSTEEEQAKPAV